MRAISSVIVCLLAVGCAAASEDFTAENQGVAELRADAASLQAAMVTRVTVFIAGQPSQDMVFNSVTGTFDAALSLPAGVHTLTAQAFSVDTLVGTSNPVAVTVETGTVTRVVLRIIDISDEAPLFGPVIDSVVFPTSIEAGSTAVFTVAALAPGSDPLTIQWVSDCQDSSFTAPSAPTTSWTKPTPGSCRLDVVATSNGFVVQESFTIVVFPPGTQNGAVDASGVFVRAPQMSFFASELSCSVSPGSNQTCENMLASPAFTSYSFSVFSWGVSSPGSITVSDNCGGHFGLSFRTSDLHAGNWLPPVSGGLCILQAHAVNADGGTGTLSVAVLARPGTPLISQDPEVGVQTSNGCSSTSSFPQQGECPLVTVGTRLSVSASAGYRDGFPGSLTITDDCGGGLFEGNSAGFISRDWIVTGAPGQVCTVTARATNLQGVLATTSVHFTLQ